MIWTAAGRALQLAESAQPSGTKCPLPHGEAGGRAGERVRVGVIADERPTLVPRRTRARFRLCRSRRRAGPGCARSGAAPWSTSEPAAYSISPTASPTTGSPARRPVHASAANSAKWMTLSVPGGSVDGVADSGRPLGDPHLHPTKGPNEGVEQRRLEVVVDEIGPSLAWATAVVTKTGTTADPASAEANIAAG